jgi:hypothetical protein
MINLSSIVCLKIVLVNNRWETGRIWICTKVFRIQNTNLYRCIYICVYIYSMCVNVYILYVNIFMYIYLYIYMYIYAYVHIYEYLI